MIYAAPHPVIQVVMAGALIFVVAYIVARYG